MDVITADQIRFFHLTSRIGRLRYLGYSVGLTLLSIVPFGIGWGLWMVSPAVGGSAFAVTELALFVLSIAFGVRRLHDLDKSGWWMLLLIVPLANLGLIIYLIFFPGTGGDNQFGDEPPPNSGWVILGALVYIACIPLGMVAALAIPSFAEHAARDQMAEAVQLATGAENAVTGYVNANQGNWPTSLPAIYPAAKQNPAGMYVASLSAVTAPGGTGYGVVVTMKTAGLSSLIAGTTMEVWTQNGVVWYCGPGGANPVSVRLLPTGCHSTDPAPY
ncbi:MAG: DUF805 domain-containing protein [Gammaproteobacteria bacterium]